MPSGDATLDNPTRRHTRPVSPPGKPLPPGAWDCHAHVFGPFDRHPLLPVRRYNPPLAPAEDYWSMLDTVGFSHGVVVHSSANGYDNSGTQSALLPGRVRGVAVVQPGITDGELRRMHAAGFRAVRITETGARAKAHSGSASFEDLDVLAPRIRALGWHIHLWSHAHTILGALDRLRAHDMPVVLDHMAYFDTERGAGDPVFQELLARLDDGPFWVKHSVVRVSKAAPDYAELRPFHDALLHAIPDRLLFGSDWPYLSLDADPPDVGKLVDLFDRWTPDEAIRRKVFADNPAALFGP